MAEIFQTHYDIERDEGARARKFTRWLGASIVAHAIFLAAVVYIPALRDTFSLARELAGFRVVSKDYKKTEVYERAVIINLAAQKLYYPAGYFEQASQTAVPPPSPDEPKFVASVHPTPEPTPTPVKPTPAASPTPQNADETAKSDEKNAKPNASPSPAEPQTVEEAERRLKESNVAAFPEINVKPFTDLLEKGRKMKDAGEIDLSGTVDLSAEADREEDGTLTHVVVTGSTTNLKLKQLAFDFISALSDSKLLATLKDTHHLHMRVGLDDKQVTVRVMTEMPNESTAAARAQDFNALLDFGKLSAKLKGKDELVLFTSTTINSKAKQVVLDFNLPRANASALLSKLAAKNQTTTPSPTPGG